MDSQRALLVVYCTVVGILGSRRRGAGFPGLLGGSTSEDPDTALLGPERERWSSRRGVSLGCRGAHDEYRSSNPEDGSLEWVPVDVGKVCAPDARFRGVSRTRLVRRLRDSRQPTTRRE